jgi:hypothetical protein
MGDSFNFPKDTRGSLSGSELKVFHHGLCSVGVLRIADVGAAYLVLPYETGLFPVRIGVDT